MTFTSLHLKDEYCTSDRRNVTCTGVIFDRENLYFDVSNGVVHCPHLVMAKHIIYTSTALLKNNFFKNHRFQDVME